MALFKKKEEPKIIQTVTETVNVGAKEPTLQEQILAMSDNEYRTTIAQMLIEILERIRAEQK